MAERKFISPSSFYADLPTPELIGEPTPNEIGDTRSDGQAISANIQWVFDNGINNGTLMVEAPLADFDPGYYTKPVRMEIALPAHPDQTQEVDVRLKRRYPEHRPNLSQGSNNGDYAILAKDVITNHESTLFSIAAMFSAHPSGEVRNWERKPATPGQVAVARNLVQNVETALGIIPLPSRER